jgi:hypothetical protein
MIGADLQLRQLQRGWLAIITYGAAGGGKKFSIRGIHSQGSQ